jgi:exopolysaccharide biosynthesis polyprenyl glycosylphosphotransferase
MHSLRRKLFWLLDLLSLLLAFAIAAQVAVFFQTQLLRGGIFYGDWVQWLSPKDAGPFPPLSEYLWVLLLVAPATVMCIDILGGHAPIRTQKLYKTFIYGLIAPFAGVGLLSTIFFILKTGGYSRLFVLSFAGTGAVAIVVSRLIAHAWNRFTLLQGMHADEVAIVGSPEAVGLVADHFRANAPSLEYSLVGYFSLPESPAVEDDSVSGLPCLGRVTDLDQVLVHQPIQRLVVVVPRHGAPWMDEVVKTNDYFRVTTHFIPEVVLDVPLKDLVAAPDSSPGKLPAMTLTPHEFQSDWLVIKRLLDVCISGILLILFAPLFLVIAALIKITTPELPVFYPWNVVGYRGRRFTGYKFTTMTAGDDKKKELAALNEMTGPVFKIANDPRITKLGKYLRKYSLNELPQLWSVFKGDMSLVGPRPAGPHELVRYELWHKRKLSAQPGITCLWQVSGRNRISNFDDWVRLDLEYIKTRSMWVDCKILLRTVWVVARGTGS